MKSPKFEKWLESQGVKWRHHPDVSLTAIDIKASLHNQARLQPIDQDRVIEMAMAFEIHRDFEDVIAYKNKNGKFVLIDGNHRIQAIELAGVPEKDKRIGVYEVLTNDPEIIERLTYTANLQNGMPNSKTDTFAHAYFMIVNRGHSIKAVAEMFYIKPPSRLESYHHSRFTQERLTALNFTKHIDTSKLTVLYSVKQDAPLLALAKLVTEANLDLTQIKDMVAIVEKHKSSEAAMLKQIETFRDLHQDDLGRSAQGRLPKKIKYDNREKLIIHMNGILRLRNEKVSSIDNILINKAKAVIATLEAICATTPVMQ